MASEDAPQQLRSAIVTGGAGGIGQVVGRRLAEDGYVVLVTDVDQVRAEEVAADLPEVAGARHAGFGGDLTSSAVNREMARAADALAPIGVLVNGIGISPKDGGRQIGWQDVDDAMWTDVLDVNLTAPFYAVRETAGLMPTDGSASIVMIESITSRLGVGAGLDEFPPFLPTTIAYGASKAGLQSLRISFMRELARRSIRVNGVAPGFVATPMMAAALPDQLVEQLPIKRYAEPAEVAEAVAYLVSPRAAYVNGACIDINGGWLPA